MLSRFSHVRLFVTLWTVARQAPLSMGFSRHEYWSGLLCPPPKDLPNPETEPTSLTSPALATGKQVLYHWASWKALKINYTSVFLKKSLSFHLLDGYCLIHWIIEQRQGDLEILLCWVLFFCRGQDWVTLVLHSPWAWDSWKEEPPYKSGALITSSATTDFPSWEHLKPQAALKSLACT